MLKKPRIKPIAIFGYIVIFLTFGVFGSWAAIARLDSAVFAPGTISLEGNRKVVQHLEGGIVEKILVQEADVVEAGQVLLRLNSVEAQSNLAVIDARLEVARIEEARLVAERTLADDFVLLGNNEIQAVSPEVAAAIEDQTNLFKYRKSIKNSRIDILTNRVQQIGLQVEGLELQKSASERRIQNFGEMIERMSAGEEKGLIQGNILAQRKDEMIQIEAALGQIVSEIAQTLNAINETKFEILQVEHEYRERANAELDDVRATIAELKQRQKIIKDILTRTDIRAPDSGTIQNLKVHTIGSVIRPGDVLMELVPQNEELIVNARVSPQDIDNVFPGLATEVRFTAFKTKLTPIMLGEVLTVSNDVITPENPQELPYYLARITVEEDSVPVDILDRLTPGMSTDVIITTGERTVANYIASPLLDAVRKSLIEE